MSNAKWTKGPWRVDKKPVRFFEATVTAPGSDEGTRLLVASCYDVQGFGGDAQANARLIAAAPLMAEALESLIDDLDAHAHGRSAPGHREHIRVARAAIAAAKREPSQKVTAS